ncbi:hypothetical protein C8R44DRAFT_878294 [Mycena epipterygia]|nr:hypothetical protein C8R44DRAFT_878294 [Mycena epipterygia]
MVWTREARCDRLRFRIPSCLFDEHVQKNEVFDAEDFVNSCFLDIAASASRVQPGQKFILLLIGHGEPTHTGEFQLCVTTKSNRLGEAWLSKRQLELAVAECQGQVQVICNSCHSRALESPKWQLVCAAGPNELAEALMISASGNVRGSAFSLCALAEVRQEQSIIIPFPRSEKRPVGTADSIMLELPSSPPPHSFTSSTRPLDIPLSNRSVPTFVDGMMNHEKCLIYESGNRFRHYGFEGSRPWHQAIPIALSQRLVDEVTITPDTRSSDNRSLPTY